jgi:hypothetical protein
MEASIILHFAMVVQGPAGFEMLFSTYCRLLSMIYNANQQYRKMEVQGLEELVGGGGG